jgi:hypothetical protein
VSGIQRAGGAGDVPDFDQVGGADDAQKADAAPAEGQVQRGSFPRSGWQDAGALREAVMKAKIALGFGGDENPRAQAAKKNDDSPSFPTIAMKYGAPIHGGDNDHPVIVMKYGAPVHGGGGDDNHPVIVMKYGAPVHGGGDDDNDGDDHPVIVMKYGAPVHGGGGDDNNDHPVIVMKYGGPTNFGGDPTPVHKHHHKREEN